MANIDLRNPSLTAVAQVKNLATTAPTASTTDTALLSMPVAAGFGVGQLFIFELFGVSSSTGTLTFKVHCGAAGTVSDNTVWTSITSAAQSANQRASFRGQVVIRVTGTSGTVEGEALGQAQAAVLPAVTGAVTTPTVATNATWFITLSAACSSGTFTAETAYIRSL
jgi:hypothetical protein